MPAWKAITDTPYAGSATQSAPATHTARVVPKTGRVSARRDSKDPIAADVLLTITTIRHVPFAEPKRHAQDAACARLLASVSVARGIRGLHANLMCATTTPRATIMECAAVQRQYFRAFARKATRAVRVQSAWRPIGTH